MTLLLPSPAPPARLDSPTRPPLRSRGALRIGPASSDDTLQIELLLRSARGSCLPLARDEIRRRLAEFEVARTPSGRVAACAALRHEAERIELRCLVVDPAWRGTGTGRALVERAAHKTHAAGRDLFCVSRNPSWFEALGFVRLPPHFVPARPGAERGRHALIRRRETPPATFEDYS